jgi:signal transduction histidine kinase
MTAISAQITLSQLELLLDSSPMATAIFRQGHLIWGNQMAIRIFGDYTQQNIATEELAVRLIPDSNIRNKVIEKLRECSGVRSDAMVRPLLVEVRNREGNQVQCEMTVNHVDGWALLYINFPGVQLYENEIVSETHKMASLGRLAQGMAHEINNPLAVIGQNLQLILQRLLMSTQKNREAAQQSGTTLECIESFMEMQGIPDMFDAALNHHIRAGKIVHQMMAFAPNDYSHRYLLQDVGELLSQAILLARKDYFQNTAMQLQHINIRTIVPDGLPGVVCQAWKIVQALFAIIRNAVEAIYRKMEDGRGGEIVICVRENQRMVDISIEDNGIGIDPNIINKIFEPYFTTKSGNLGTGLGLASCYYVIHQEHFGEISVASMVDQGSVFTVSLPASAENGPEES